MHVVVIGGGVVGVTTAWYLRCEGHAVTLLEARTGPGLGTSFANAGEISPGYAAPWAAPGVPLKALSWLFSKHPPLVVRPSLDREMLTWIGAFLRNCTVSRYSVNKERMVRLAEYSRDQLKLLRAETGVRYDEGTGGTLQLFRNASEMDRIAKNLEVLRDRGVAHEVLDAAGYVGAEPGLAGSASSIAGGLRLPDDETGDCFKFTSSLAALAQHAGVQFHYSATVSQVDRSGNRVRGVRLTDGTCVGGGCRCCCNRHELGRSRSTARNQSAGLPS